MKSLDAFEARIEAMTESRVITTIAVNLLKAGKFALEDIADACGMTLQQVQELAATIQR